MKQPEYKNEDEEAGFAQQKQSRRRSRCGKRGNTDSLPALRKRCELVLSEPKVQSKDAAPLR
ncbi:MULTISPECIES: hypothetical protein [unclassified Paraflavitalea]|uniref:hypothetical protein n=1 Tax=unclassified Paraflavitalea TaxID=2798305 RepID=UPI003D355002